MRNKNFIKLLTVIMVMVMAMSAFAGCGKKGTEVSAATGTLIVKVNPELEINYDEKGNVISVMPKNEDAVEIMEDYTGYQGKATREVIKKLVSLMNEAGYIKTDDDGKEKNINIEVKYGSAMPDEKFLVDIMKELKGTLEESQIAGQLVLSADSDYGISQYDLSDYGVISHAGNTDYDSASDYDDNDSVYDSASDYDDNDSVYDSDSTYDSSDYGTSSGTTVKPTTSTSASNTDYDSASDYDDNDFVYDSDSVYDASDYGDTTDYNTTDYDTTDYDTTDYDTEDDASDYDDDNDSDYDD